MIFPTALQAAFYAPINDVDFPGNDIGTVKTGTPFFQCKYECDAVVECIGFLHNSFKDDGSCWLKSKAELGVFVPGDNISIGFTVFHFKYSETATPGPRTSIPNTDNIVTPNIEEHLEAAFTDCYDLCIKLNTKDKKVCYGYVFNKLAGKGCFLKGEMNPVDFIADTAKQLVTI